MKQVYVLAQLGLLYMNIVFGFSLKKNQIRNEVNVNVGSLNGLVSIR